MPYPQWESYGCLIVLALAELSCAVAGAVDFCFVQAPLSDQDDCDLQGY